MLSVRSVSLGLLALCGQTWAAYIPARDLGLIERQATSTATTTRVADAACTHGPTTRSCWKSGFSIATDFDAKAPPAGKVVTYDLDITNTTMAPDGISRLVMAINNQYPGPTITADWGDTLVVRVKNSLQDNGTSIHWHGLRMLNANQQDGANGITECPIAPGQTKTYTFKCTQFGTSWYHSHHSAQYADGIVGPIVINGPASANYDEDLGPYAITDWFHDTAFNLNVFAMHSTSGPPKSETALIRGKMKNPSGGGAYDKTTGLKPGKKYRLRLINTGIDNYFAVSLDGHELTVITADFVPIKTFTTKWVTVGIGQRHDVVFTANQAVGNYWLRVEPLGCRPNLNAGNIRAIFSYENAPNAEPTSSMFDGKPTVCADQVGIQPYVSNTVPQDQFAAALRPMSMDFNVAQKDGQPLIQWLINGTDIDVEWDKPTLQYVVENNSSWPQRANVVEIDHNKWTFWLVQTVQGDPVNLPHPIHLHGHDFYVLGSGAGIYPTDFQPKFVNPPRRDTATLPAAGWLLMGFPADNPGAWLMHCHIPWHVGQGLSMQFLERKSEIVGAIAGAGGLGEFNNGCASWKTWWNGPGRHYQKDDSGL